MNVCRTFACKSNAGKREEQIDLFMDEDGVTVFLCVCNFTSFLQARMQHERMLQTLVYAKVLVAL